MSNFSGAIKLGDLSDFIAPSQACVVKLDGNKVTLDDADIAEAGVVEARSSAVGGNKGFSQTRLQEDNSIKVTLQDCLACSGCVTSAETVLLEHQSIEEFSAKLQEEGITVIVSISPQSRASLAEASGLTPVQVLRRLTHFFQELGVKHVFDTTDSRDLSLVETAAEFLARYRAAKSQPTGNGNTSSTGSNVLPMMASACPGWVCYAEKTHGRLVLPNISTAKSPQAVMGTVVKGLLCRRLALDPAAVYHTAVMPCYDKKLEASRSDFTLPGGVVAEVDSVLTTAEVAQLIDSQGTRLQDLAEASAHPLLPLLPAGPSAVPGGPSGDNSGATGDDGGVNLVLYGYPGGAGGYLEHVFRTAARELFGQEVPPGPLKLRNVRNADLKEATLECDGAVVLRFAAVYGFRNIQTVMRQLKGGRCRYDYVEIMACPSGCLNGGGQLKAKPGQTQAQLVAALDDAYHHASIVLRKPEENPMLLRLYAEEFGGRPYSEAAQESLHTEYHTRDKPVAAIVASDW